tara:strand:+ start:416 stop:979 length:564 start_codon:yes stop_codon:yes gene_type:complete
MIQTPKHMFWTCAPEYFSTAELPDPRLAVARYTGWKKLHTPETDYCTPEPDNYNRAILSRNPVDCTIVEDQVIYYISANKLWITLMYVPEELVVQVDTWMAQCKPLAYWQHLRAPKIKPTRGLLWARGNIRDDTQTDNERLFTMGYFDEFKVKYFSDDTTYVDSLLGEARAALNSPQPEAEDNDEFE